MTYVMDSDSDFYCDLLKFVSAVDALSVYRLFLATPSMTAYVLAYE